MVALLNASPICTLDPGLQRRAYRPESRILTAYDDGTIQQLYELAKQLENTQPG